MGQSTRRRGWLGHPGRCARPPVDGGGGFCSARLGLFRVWHCVGPGTVDATGSSPRQASQNSPWLHCARAGARVASDFFASSPVRPCSWLFTATRNMSPGRRNRMRRGKDGMAGLRCFMRFRQVEVEPATEPFDGGCSPQVAGDAAACSPRREGRQRSSPTERWTPPVSSHTLLISGHEGSATLRGDAASQLATVSGSIG
jgi:hypothetical protein